MNDLTPVLAVIKQMVTAYQELLQIQEQKRDLLVAGDVESLPALQQAELKMLSAVQRLEKERLTALQEVFGAQASAESWTLQKLQSVASPVQRLQIRAAGEALQEAVRQVQALHDLNKRLIGQSLQYVQYTLDLLTGEPGELVPTYSRQDVAPGGTGSARSMFDSKV